jgi:NDP-sugar pyrophosphorylase family protein
MTEVRAIVLAAGFGTRLRPLTEWIPKPLIPLGKVPLLGHILDSIRAAGISDVAVNAHHLPEQLMPSFLMVTLPDI